MAVALTCLFALVIDLSARGGAGASAGTTIDSAGFFFGALTRLVTVVG